jgi:hypothetical protein
MKKVALLVISSLLLLNPNLYAQVAINTDGSSPDNSAMLDVKSSDKGLLIPRLTTAQRTTLATIAVAGLIVYDTSLNKFFLFNGTTWAEVSTGGLWTKNGSITYLTNTGDKVGIGTTTPARALEVKGGWQTARLSTITDGAFLEFDGTNATDWAVGSWSGTLRMISSTDNFTTTVDQYLFSTASFYPSANNGRTLGTSTGRWSNLYSVGGNFSGNVGIGPNSPGAELEVSTATGEPEIRITRPSSTYGATLSFYTGASGEWNFTTVSGNENMVIYRGAGNTIGNLSLMHTGGNVGVGTMTPARTFEVAGTSWQTARISSNTTGAILEFKSTDATNWAFGTYAGQARLLSTVNNFTNVTDEYWFTTTSFYPYTDNARTLGASNKRWSTLYGGTGNFSSAGTGIPGATVYSVNSGTSGIGGYFESNGTDATIAMKQNGTGNFLKLFGPSGGNEELSIFNNGTINLFNSNYTKTIEITPYEGGTTTGGQITLYNSTGVATIQIDGDYTGDGRITTNELEITGGSDLSELFDLTDYDDIQKGMVVIIDENNPGNLRVSQTSYDRKVAGIVSGANDIKPGLIMSQKGTIADGEHLIALSGRVYCMADATNNPIQVGDLLTTSNVPGHAMKVEDFDKAHGAIIGKAMTSLDSGKGLVLVLVSLQ